VTRPDPGPSLSSARTPPSIHVRAALTWLAIFPLVAIGITAAAVQHGAMFCASVVYPVDSEGFDFDYFRDHHAPRFAELLGENAGAIAHNRFVDPSRWCQRVERPATVL
jgi:hypothetical protein